MSNWQCCGRNYTPGVSRCRGCGKVRPEYSMDGHESKTTGQHIASDRQKQWAKGERKKARKSPPTDDSAGEGFIMTTLPGGPRI